jgi:chromosomal replication initiator protein
MVVSPIRGVCVDVSTLEKISHLRELVADRIGPTRYRTWFGDTAEFRLNHDSLDVMVSNSFVGNWIASNYLDDLAASAQEILGADVQVDVRVVEMTTSSNAGVPDGPRLHGAAPKPARRTRAERPRLRGRLDDFVVGPSNRLAYAAARQMLRDPGKAFKLLVVHGGCGLGKTHLLQGICNGLIRNHPTLEWRYISGEQFTNEFISAVKAGRADRFRARFRSVDELLIDDIHVLANKKATQEEFLHTFDAIDASGKAVVLSSDRHPRGIGTLSEPLINRLIAGMVVEIEPPDFEVRREILCRRAATMNCRIPDEVFDLVAERIARNVRELEGALFKLVALASLTKDPITLDLARTTLDDHIVHTCQTPNVDSIIRMVGTRFGVSREQILSKSRDRTISLARAAAMCLIRKHTLMSFPEIGRAMGNKSHSTVVMATQRIDRLLKQNSTVTWKTANGTHEALLGGLLEGFEKELFPPRP